MCGLAVWSTDGFEISYSMTGFHSNSMWREGSTGVLLGREPEKGLRVR